jgi:hypothetical protein
MLVLYQLHIVQPEPGIFCHIQVAAPCIITAVVDCYDFIVALKQCTCGMPFNGNQQPTLQAALSEATTSNEHMKIRQYLLSAAGWHVPGPPERCVHCCDCCFALQFLSLLENGLIQDMLTLYTERQIHSVLRFGTPVCGHPTIVHGGMISALFDETFGVLLYAAGHWGHLDLQQVFTARLEVDYKKV